MTPKAPKDEQSASNTLADSIDRAIAESLRLVRTLQTRTADNLRALKNGAARLASLPDLEEANADVVGLIHEFIHRLTSRVQEVEALYDRQIEALRTFNIAVFGRTQVGKSSLIEALVHGNGSSVSDGRADYTTEVNGRTWRGCRVIDTPGINGWGRTASREELEARARSAVEVADVVLLCFDNANQQAMEFEKAAKWVRDYGKPCVALINIKNHRWRFVPRVPSLESRRSIQQQVNEHVGYLRECLTSIHLERVPIVALSSQRALFARAATPYLGPSASQRQAQLDKYGAAVLEDWSNVAAFEALIIGALRLDVAGLRLGMLYEQSSAILSRLVEDLTQIREDADRIRQPLEGTLLQLLKLFGVPPAKERKQKECECFYVPYQRLEDQRGEFAAPIVGEYGRFLRQQLSARVNALRSKSVTKAEALILDAFDRRINLSTDELRDQVFEPQKLTETLTAIEAEVRSFASRRAKLAIEGAELDLKWDLELNTEAKGAVDGGAFSAGYVIRGLGAGLSLVTALAMAFSTLNIWNPIGWVGITVGTLASWFLSWFGSESLKKAEAKRLNARRQALSSAQTEIDERYDRIISNATQQLESYGQRVLALGASPLLVACNSLWSLQQLTNSEMQRLQEALGKQSPPIDAQELLQRAARQTAEERFPGLRAEQQLFWGESWLDGSPSLDSPLQTSNRWMTSGFSAADFLALNPSPPEPAQTTTPFAGAGRRWLARAQTELAAEPLAAHAISMLLSKVALACPEVHFVGDYNAGKSSLIRRLLIEDEQPIPPQLQISARPTTARTCGYYWRSVSLVDTPGFQSRDRAHAAQTLHALPAAALIVYVFQPSLITGDLTPLFQILIGDRARGLVGKAANTLFVINRCDDLGIDPAHDPQGYVEVCQRKRAELIDALAARNVLVRPEQILCVTSNPFTVLGDGVANAPEALVNTRAWDGIDAVLNAFDAREKDLRSGGLDRALLEAGTAWLTDALHSLSNHHNANAAKCKLLDHGASILADALQEAARMAEAQRASLSRIVEEYARVALDAAWAARSEHEIQQQADNLATWWESPEFQAAVRDWSQQTKGALDDWLANWVEGLQRHMSTAVFHAKFPQLKFSRLIPDAQEKTGPVAKAAKRAGGVLKNASRDAVYQFGKFLGVNFKPWGAVNLAAKLAKVGAVMGLISSGLEIVSLLSSARKSKEREQLRKQMAQQLVKQAEQVVATLLDPVEGLGPTGFLLSGRKELERISLALEAERRPLVDEAASLSARQVILHTLIEDAWLALEQGPKSSVEGSDVQ